MNEKPKKDNSFFIKLLLAAAVFSFLILILYLLAKIAHILLIIFMGILLGVVLDGLMLIVLRRAAMPRIAAFFLVAIILTGIISLIVYLIGPGLVDQFVLLSQKIPEAYDSIKTTIIENSWGRILFKENFDPSRVLPPVSDVLGGISGIFSTTFGVIATIFVVFFVGIYLALSPDYYQRNLIKIVPPRHRERAAEILSISGRALRWWFLGRLVSMTVVGILMSAGLAISGIPLALTLGFIAAILCFVPYIGPALSAIPPILVAVTDNPTKIIYALIVYAVVQTLESYIITPLIQKRAVFIPPALLISGQVIMGVIAGAIGIVLATPLMLVIIIFAQKLYFEGVLGDKITVLGQHESGT